MKTHTYRISVNWTGNLGLGTQNYQAYSRSHSIQTQEKPLIEGSSDPAFRGDPSKYNPEELFLSSLSTCHMLWYLHLCSANQITVVKYQDHSNGVMVEEKSGAGRFLEVTLFPDVEILESQKIDLATSLHKAAHENCFIANSVNFPVKHIPTIKAVKS